MNARTADALRRLRAADPAAATGDEPWAGSPAEAVVQRRGHEHTALPVDDLVQVRGVRESRRWPAAVAAAAVVAAVGIGAAALAGSQPGTGPDKHSPVHGGPVVPASNRVRAEALVGRLLAAAPVLPHAVRHGSSPGGIRFDAETPGSRHLITRTAWWTAPGTVDEAIRYLDAHAPARTTNTGSFGSGGTGRDFQGVTFAIPATGSAASPELQVSVTRYHGGVAVQAQAQAIWLPRRPAWTKVTDPREVAVTVQRGMGHPAVHRTLRGPDLHRLAHVINALRVAPDLGVQNCPMAVPDQDQALTFVLPARTVTAHVTTTGCTVVTMSAEGHRPFHLEPGALSQIVLKLLGLKPIRR